MTSRTRRIVCADCGQLRYHHARGLCASCVKRRTLAGTLDERPARRQSNVGVRCPCGKPARTRGLCDYHYQQQHLMRAALAAGREYRPRRRPAAAPDPLHSSALYVDTWRCAGCGTTIRPRHSAGLCVDCVRAAGRLAVDPWEAA